MVTELSSGSSNRGLARSSTRCVPPPRMLANCERPLQQEEREQRRTLGQAVEIDELMVRVRATANGAESVERGRVEARRIAIGASARRVRAEDEAELLADPAGGFPQRAISPTSKSLDVPCRLAAANLFVMKVLPACSATCPQATPYPNVR